jgi:hypothetical protein
MNPDTTHLSTTLYTTGDAFTEMKSRSAGSLEFDVIPKPGNMTWTSIKSCIGMWPGSNTYLRTTLVNMDTGETYYWNRNSKNGACTKETFDIPIHTHHQLKLKMSCFSGTLPAGVTDYCRGWVILSSSIQQVIQ